AGAGSCGAFQKMRSVPVRFRGLPRHDLTRSALQRRKCLRWPAVFGRLFVGVGILDQGRLAESSAQESESGGQRVISESHGDSNGRKARLRREDLTIGARGSASVAQIS